MREAEADWGDPEDVELRPHLGRRAQEEVLDQPALEELPPWEAEQTALTDEPEIEAGPVTLRFWVLLRTMAVIGLTGGIVATLLTWWTPNTFLPTESMDQLAIALATQSGQGIMSTSPTSTPTEVLPPNNIGIISGHRGLHRTSGLPDPGAVCADGLSEQEVNEAIALQTVALLEGHGYTVDLLDEFDTRLDGYRALAMVSIHADSCDYINEFATGFKVASFAGSSTPQRDAQLVACLVKHYSETTGLNFHPSITFDMTQYHTFLEIAPDTPGAIIETGFLYLDRELLTQHADLVALGIARGLLCYLRNDPLPGTAMPTGTPSEPPGEVSTPASNP